MVVGVGSQNLVTIRSKFDRDLIGANPIGFTGPLGYNIAVDDNALERISSEKTSMCTVAYEVVTQSIIILYIYRERALVFMHLVCAHNSRCGHDLGIVGVDQT